MSSRDVKLAKTSASIILSCDYLETAMMQEIRMSWQTLIIANEGFQAFSTLSIVFAVSCALPGVYRNEGLPKRDMEFLVVDQFPHQRNS